MLPWIASVYASVDGCSIIIIALISSNVVTISSVDDAAVSTASINDAVATSSANDIVTITLSINDVAITTSANDAVVSTYSNDALIAILNYDSSTKLDDS
jgi:hypothetical protein